MWHPSAPLFYHQRQKNVHSAMHKCPSFLHAHYTVHTVHSALILGPPPLPKEDVSCVSTRHSLSFHFFWPITLYLYSYLTLYDAGVWMLQLTFICVHIGYCSPVDNDTVWVWQSVSKLDSFCSEPDMFLKRFPFVGHRFCRWRIFRKLNLTKTFKGR